MVRMVKKIAILLALTLLFVSCTSQDSKERKLTIFHAGSLAKPFKAIKKAFEKENPNVKVLLEASGSRACARKITDQKKIADIMASADESVIRSLLMPKYTSWGINFVTNEMAIMYNKDSKYSNEINSDNWYEILLRPNVNYGHSDPNLDPCGYRTILTWQLAEIFYNEKGLFEKLNNMPKRNIRPKEVDLLAMLDAGELDYLFIYRSVAKQHHGKFIELPQKINLGSFEFKEFYKNASIQISGKKPGSFITKKGAPMVYGITILNNAANKSDAVKFLDFLLSPKGNKIMSENGHPIINPAETLQDKALIPTELQKYIK